MRGSKYGELASVAGDLKFTLRLSRDELENPALKLAVNGTADDIVERRLHAEIAV
jgi:hypothetical protein